MKPSRDIRITEFQYLGSPISPVHKAEKFFQGHINTGKIIFLTYLSLYSTLNKDEK